MDGDRTDCDPDGAMSVTEGTIAPEGLHFAQSPNMQGHHLLFVYYISH